jgi:hypothetical protein
MALLHLGQRDAGERDLNEALTLYRQVGNLRGAAKALSNLGFFALENGTTQLAEARLQESLRLHDSLGDREASALCREGLAGCALAEGDAPRGAAQFAIAAAIRARINAPVRPVDAEGHQKLREKLIAALGEAAFSRILDEQLTAQA